MGVEDRPARLPRHREVHLKGISSFASFVPFETVAGALFNYWEPSLFIGDIRKSDARVHLSQVDRDNPEGALNLVVIHDIRRDGKRSRSDYYFGTFRGKHSGQVETDTEYKEFWDKLSHIYSRHHRVAGSELDALIRNAAKLDDEFPLSWS